MGGYFSPSLMAVNNRPHTPLSVEELERRDLQDATPLAVPPALAGHPIVNDWQNAHQVMDATKAYVSELNANLSNLGIELQKDTVDAGQADERMDSAADRMSSADRERDSWQQTIDQLTGNLQTLAGERIAHQQAATVL